MSMSFSATRMWARISTKIEAGINATAREAAEIARQKAPVRKVFKGSVGRATPAVPVRGSGRGHPPAHGRVWGPVRSGAAHLGCTDPLGHAARELAAPGRLALNTPLTARGRWELKTGRAILQKSQRQDDLRWSPPWGDPRRSGGERRTDVGRQGGESRPRYAKYVEFGTRRSRAQPYLRPALSQVRESFRTRMRAAARLGRSA